MAKPAVKFEELVAFVAGKLDPVSATEVERRIARSPKTAATARRVGSLLETVRADDSVAPSAAALERARALFRERRPAKQPGLLDALKRAVAELIYDSRPQLALAGVRGAGDSYQLSFESETADVDLDIAPIDRPNTVQRQVFGQITLHTEARVDRITLAMPGTTDSVATAEPDENGVFSIATDCGTFDVLIALPDTLVVLPNVEIE